MTARDWSGIDRLLDQDIQTSQQLLALFNEERQALQQRSYEAFEQLLNIKAELIRALETSTTARRRWQLQQGFDDDAAALAAAVAERPELASRWRQLADLWNECQQANRINEQVAQRTRVVVGRVLDILSGNAGLGGTYDAAGGKRRLQTGRNITSA